MLGVKAMGRRKNNYIFAPEGKKKSGPGCLILILSLFLCGAILGFLINNALNQKLELRQEKIAVMNLDKTYEGFGVLHISDLHGESLTADINTWRSLLFGRSYSAVVLSGDMVGKTGNYEPLLQLIDILKQISPTVPIYFCAGDEDPTPVISAYRGSPEVVAEWVKAAQAAGAVYLDAPIAQPVGKNNVWFVPEYLYSVDAAGVVQSLTHQKEEMEAKGQQYEAEGGASYRALCYRLEAMERTVEALKVMTAKDLQIAVSHVPLDTDYIRTAVEWADQAVPFNFKSVALVMAGHYVGGQWRLSGLGPLYVPEKGWLPGDSGIVGLQRINSVNQYITVGLGASSFYPTPGRLFNKPGLALLTFTAKIQ